MQNIAWITSLLTTIQGAAYQLTTYTSTNLPYYIAQPVDNTTKSATLLACIVLCDSKYDSCFSVTYNNMTGSCTPRAGISYDANNPPRTPTELFLYTDHCNKSLGFSLFVFRTVVQCLYVSTHEVNFSSARETCAEKGSTLYLVKSRDKFNLLQSIVNTITFSHTWIGLTDIATEGIFVWDDLTSPVYPLQWRKHQPDNGIEGENCVISERLTGYYNDYGCSLLNCFVCEMNSK